MTGRIKSVVADRGFGFIESPEYTAGDVFFHASALTNTSFDDVMVGQKVKFDMERDERSGKQRAANVLVG